MDVRTRICPYCGNYISYYATICPVDGRPLPSNTKERSFIDFPVMPGIYYPVSIAVSILTGVRAKSLICGLMALLFVYCFFWFFCAYKPRLYERILILAAFIFAGLFMTAVYLPHMPLPTLITNLASPWATAQFVANFLTEHL